MSQLIRQIYSSRSTFSPSAAHQGLDPGVARILAKSRRNNAAKGIVGGLLFGDGCFLQCLEGDAQAVDALYDRIRTDPRHRDVTVLSRRAIVRTSFGAWSMKFAPGEEPLRRFMQGVGMERFDPYAMSPETIEAAVDYMERSAESTPAVGSASTGRVDTPAAMPSARSLGTVGSEPPAVQAPLPTTSGAGPGLAVKAIVGVLVVAGLLGWGYWSYRG